MLQEKTQDLCLLICNPVVPAWPFMIQAITSSRNLIDSFRNEDFDEGCRLVQQTMQPKYNTGFTPLVLDFSKRLNFVPNVTGGW